MVTILVAKAAQENGGSERTWTFSQLVNGHFLTCGNFYKGLQDEMTSNRGISFHVSSWHRGSYAQKKHTMCVCFLRCMYGVIGKYQRDSGKSEWKSLVRADSSSICKTNGRPLCQQIQWKMIAVNNPLKASISYQLQFYDKFQWSIIEGTSEASKYFQMMDLHQLSCSDKERMLHRSSPLYLRLINQVNFSRNKTFQSIFEEKRVLPIQILYSYTFVKKNAKNMDK